MKYSVSLFLVCKLILFLKIIVKLAVKLTMKKPFNLGYTGKTKRNTCINQGKRVFSTLWNAEYVIN